MADKIEVFSFGENEKDKWYAGKDQKRIPCTEIDIENLWNQWIVAPGVERADDTEYVIFKLTQEPIYLEK